MAVFTYFYFEFETKENDYAACLKLGLTSLDIYLQNPYRFTFVRVLLLHNTRNKTQPVQLSGLMQTLSSFR